MVDFCNLSSDSYWLQDMTQLHLNDSFTLGYIVVITLLITLSIILNALLMLAILKSPTLNTQPNAFLVGICINGIVLSVAASLDVTNMVILYSSSATGNSSITAVSSLPFNTTTPSHALNMTTTPSHALSASHNIIFMLSLTSYWIMFLAITYYKSCVAEDPYLPYLVRRSLVLKSLMICWVCATLSTALYSVIWLLRGCVRTNYPGVLLYNVHELIQTSCSADSDWLVRNFSLSVLILHYALMLISTVLIVITIRRVIRLQKILPSSRSSRVAPQPSISSDSLPRSKQSTAWGGEDGSVPTLHTGSIPSSIYMYILDSSSSSGSSDMPHKTFSPHLFSAKTDLPDHSHRNNNRASSTFTDLSKKRLSTDMRRDIHAPNKYVSTIIKVNTSIKNLVVMLIIFVLCTAATIVASAPYSLSRLAADTRVYLTLVIKTIFYLNSIAYPLWYFSFTQKVRKILNCGCES